VTVTGPGDEQADSGRNTAASASVPHAMARRASPAFFITVT
jgi:hypothetical protein